MEKCREECLRRTLRGVGQGVASTDSAAGRGRDQHGKAALTGNPS
jgi:hypothetical protein